MTTGAGLIVILGSPNDDQGNLSTMAQGRVALGYQWYQARRAAGWKLLLTGGFGEHFNRTNHPHAYYLQQWLLVKGVPTQEIVDFALSHHTGEDALLARPIVERQGVRRLLVVTSDLHLARAEFIRFAHQASLQYISHTWKRASKLYAKPMRLPHRLAAQHYIWVYGDNSVGVHIKLGATCSRRVTGCLLGAPGA